MPDKPLKPEVAELLSAAGVEKADVDAAWGRFRTRRASAPPRHGWVRPRWLMLIGAAVLVGALGFTPAGRSATDRMLGLFRINTVTALPVNDTALEPLARGGSADMIAHLLSDELTVNRDEPNQTVNGLGAAAAAAGFTVLAPATAPGPARYLVVGGKDLTLKVDRARAQALIDTVGPAGLTLPASLDNAVISAHLARSVVIAYGACAASIPQPDTRKPSPGPDCTVLDQSPSPQVNLPPGLDMQQLAAVGLQLLGMSAAEARQYTQTIDWNSTLVIPFPSAMAASRPVTVNGDQGILLTSNRPGKTGGPGYVLIWAHQGMLYSIAGAGDGANGLALASQLQP